MADLVSTIVPTPLRRTALHATHHAHKAKMVDFGGWDMPVQYEGLVAEHMAVRTGVGIFDVSHMGDIQLRGPNSLAAVQKLLMNDASKLQMGRRITRRCCIRTGRSSMMWCCTSWARMTG
jgi:aminomethyltransferase